MKSIAGLVTVISLASHVFAAPTVEKRNVVFMISTEPNNQGEQGSWVVDRWKCHDLAADGLDNQASWAFVAAGLANGCTLYDDNECQSEKSLNVEKNNSNVLGPGPVNLTDYNFDKVASSFSCY